MKESIQMNLIRTPFLSPAPEIVLVLSEVCVQAADRGFPALPTPGSRGRAGALGSWDKPMNGPFEYCVSRLWSILMD